MKTHNDSLGRQQQLAEIARQPRMVMLRAVAARHYAKTGRRTHIVEIMTAAILEGMPPPPDDPPIDDDALPMPPLLAAMGIRGPPGKDAARTGPDGANNNGSQHNTRPRYQPQAPAAIAPPEDVLYSSEHEDEPDDDDLLTPWERDFLASVEAQDYDLTDRQQDKLNEIEQALEERRAMWRAGHRRGSWR